MIKLKNWPTDSKRITSPFGPRWGEFHDGDDIGAVEPGIEGDDIYAVADGEVIISKVNGGGVTKGYGYYIAIKHDGFCTLYGHLQGLIVQVGQVVKSGQIVGKMGSTGTSTAAHLHFRLIEGNTVSFEKDSTGKTKGSVNPEPFLRESEVIQTSNPTKEEVKIRESDKVSFKIPLWGQEACKWAAANGIDDGVFENLEEVRQVVRLYNFYKFLKLKGMVI